MPVPSQDRQGPLTVPPDPAGPQTPGKPLAFWVGLQVVVGKAWADPAPGALAAVDVGVGPQGAWWGPRSLAGHGERRRYAHLAQ